MSLFVDFAGMNSLIQDAVTSSQNYIGYPLGSNTSSYAGGFPLSSSGDYLVALNLHRNGPYGYSTFRQIRVSENNLSRLQKKNNSFSFVEMPSEAVNISQDNNDLNFVSSRYGKTNHYTEMPIISRYKPLVFKFGVGIDNPRIENKPALSVPNIENILVYEAHGNEINFFSNEELNRKLGVSTLTDREYELIKNFYLNGGLDADDSPISTFTYLKYRENIYPREINMYRSHIRARTNFENNFWKHSRNDRENSTSLFSTIYGGSKWYMDANTDWPSLNISTSDSDVFKSGADQSLENGILQNNVALFWSYQSATPPKKLKAMPYYNRQHALHHSMSVVSPSGISIPETASIGSAGPLFAGFAEWQAASQSGKYPFYNTYDDFHEDLRFKYKDYAILPEYRASRFLETYYSASSKYVLNNFLEVTGGISGSNLSNQEDFYDTYSTADFFKNFAKIRKDHKGFVDPSLISLTCRVVKKFVPYNSFYPQQRTVDLASQYWNSFSAYVSASNYSSIFGDKEYGKQNFMVPMFAPGVLFNSIKAGVACDYPLSSETGSTEDLVLRISDTIDSKKEYCVIGEYDKRVPFEALINPQNYLAGYKIINQEPHPSGSDNNGAAIWNGGGNNLYNIMASNFCAEVADFFMANGQFTFLESKKQGDANFGSMVSGNIYTMRVKMFRSTTGPNPSIVNTAVITDPTADYTYIPPQDIPSGTLFISGDPRRETMTMYSRPSAFGPPVGGYKILPGFSIPNFSGSSVYGYNLPHTPPYYNGEAWAHISYTATKTGKHTLDEILRGAEIKYYRVDPQSWLSTFDSVPLNGPTACTSSADLSTSNYHLQKINTNAMQIDASLNLLSSRTTGFSRNETNSPNDSTWVIQTKFETPILNFKNVTVNTGSQQAQTPRGMWHQYGEQPTGDEGIYMMVEDIPRGWHAGAEQIDLTTVRNNYKSLADVVGFDKTPVRLGNPKDRKQISEAIVAIPFTEVDNEKKFFELDPSILKGPQFSTSTIADMISKMNKFILPPQFDFNKDSTITPFAMYIFEFSHTLDEQDLTDIWQGVSPKIATEHEEATVSISHPILAKELLGTGVKDDNRKFGAILPDKIKWMVFKVKKRAKREYYSKIIGSEHLKTKGSTKSYVTPNWPYDYFSLVELAKMEGEIKFSKIDEKGEIVRDITLGDSINEKSTRTQGVDSATSDVSERAGILLTRDPDGGFRDDGPDQPPPPVPPQGFEFDFDPREKDETDNGPEGNEDDPTLGDSNDTTIISDQ